MATNDTPRLINGKNTEDRTYMFNLGKACGEAVRESGEELDTNFLADNHMVAMRQQGFRFRSVEECRNQWNAGYQAGYGVLVEAGL